MADDGFSREAEGSLEISSVGAGAAIENRSCESGVNELSPPPLIQFSSIPTDISREYPLNPWERMFLGLIGCTLVCLFAIAASLTPEQQGYGTHQQLGLPPCSIRKLFGISCPTCGMTTSFAYFVRGNIVGACRVNPAGLLVAASCFLFIPWSFIGVIRGKLLWVSAPVETALLLVSLLIGVSLITWIIQLL